MSIAGSISSLAGSTPRSLLVGLVVVGIGIGIGIGVQDCGERSPEGFHHPNVVWGRGELGVVWLDGKSNGNKRVFVKRAVEDQLDKGPVDRLSNAAKHADPPLIGHTGERYVLAWSHAGEDPGVYLGVVPGGAAQRVFPGEARVCPQMVERDGEITFAFHDDAGYHVVRVKFGGATLAATSFRIEASAQAGDELCRLAWSGRELGLLHARGDGLALDRFTYDGELVGSATVATGRGTVVAADVEHHAGGFAVAYALRDTPGAAIVIHDPGGSVDRRVSVARDAYVRGLDLADAGLLTMIWSEFAKPDAGHGLIYFGAVRQGRMTDKPLRLTPRRRARPIVRASGKPDRIAVAWTEERTGGTVLWGYVTLGRAADGSVLAAFHSAGHVVK